MPTISPRARPNAGSKSAAQLSAAECARLAQEFAAQGLYVRALPHFEQALASAKRDVDLRLQYADTLSRAGHVADAAYRFCEVLKLDPKRKVAAWHLSRILSLGQLNYPGVLDAAGLQAALKFPEVGHEPIARACVAHACSEGPLLRVLTALRERTSDATSRERLPLTADTRQWLADAAAGLVHAKTNVGLTNSCLLTGLMHGPVRDIDVERLLTAVRAHILLHLPTDRFRDRNLAGLLEALTHQIHLNGFVWDVGQDEAALLDRQLGDVWQLPSAKLAARMDSVVMADPSDAARFALYLPVTALALPVAQRGRQRIVRCAPWLRASKDALTKKLHREAEIAGRLRWFMADDLASDDLTRRGSSSHVPGHSPVMQAASGARSGSHGRAASSIGLEEIVAVQQPSVGSGLRELSKRLAPAKVEVGTAGVRVLITSARDLERPLRAPARYGPKVTIDVVDQDAGALAKLQRRLEEAGNAGQVSCWRTDSGALRRVGAGDGLRGRGRYDLIECVDMLARERAPIETWTALMELLKPGGFALIGVPSRRTREAVLDLAFDEAYPGDVSDHQAVRAFRQHLFANPPGNDPAFARRPDIWTLSAFKRFALPCDEQPFDLAIVAKALPQLEARFLGLQTTRACQSAFDTFVRGQKQAGVIYTDDISKWAAFDAAHPEYFAGGYTFWIQKREH